MEDTNFSFFINLQKVYYPLLFIMGVPANLFTFYMICFRNCGMSESAAVYLSCLAVVDTSYLVWVILIDLTLTFWQVRPFWHSHPWCGILGIFQYGSLYSSSWIIVVFTIERYLVLKSAATRQHLSQARVTRMTCGGIIVMSHLVSVPIAWINEVTPFNRTTAEGANVTLLTCHYRDATYTTVLVWINASLSIAVPIVLIIVFNYLIGYHLSRASQLFTKEERRVMRGRSARGMVRRTIMLLGTVSVAFVALSLPRFVTYCILRTMYNREAFNRNDYGIPINVASDVANMLQNLNSTTNFLLYCVVSRRFRQELVRVLACKPRTRELGSMITHTTMKVFSVRTASPPPLTVTVTTTRDPVAVVLTNIKYREDSWDAKN